MLLLLAQCPKKFLDFDFDDSNLATVPSICESKNIFESDSSIKARELSLRIVFRTFLLFANFTKMLNQHTFVKMLTDFSKMIRN